MRIWDIDPGYLARQSLLGEHRELHGVVAILVQGRSGYSRHPETMRWAGYGWALRQRHRLVVCEMGLRGYAHMSPVATRSNKDLWPPCYVDPPSRQFRLLEEKYAGRTRGRIPLPKSAQELWRQHKYSVLARDPGAYAAIGREVSTMEGDFAALARRLTELLRVRPAVGGIRNAVEHMWGHVADAARPRDGEVASWPLRRLFRETRKRALASGDPYLMSSTALGELMAWLPDAARAAPGGRGRAAPPLGRS